jgi:hypothetical protein
MEGYTLALDFPVRPGLLEFLDDLDRIVLAYGGRLYLSKDARMPRDVFWKSYPHSQKFLAIVQQYNPDFLFRSVQSDRLGITCQKDYLTHADRAHFRGNLRYRRGHGASVRQQRV